MGAAPRQTAASRVMPIPVSAREISSIARQSERKSPPAPPYSSENGRPKRPSSPICRTTSYPNFESRSSSSAAGATTSRAKSRHVSRIACCSLVSSKSTSSILACVLALDPLRHLEFAERLVDHDPGADKAISLVKRLGVLVAFGHPEKDLAQILASRPLHHRLDQRGPKPTTSKAGINPQGGEGCGAGELPRA